MLYAGIGSRQTPNNILLIMQQLGRKLRTDNYILRSGGALGADSTFEYYISEPDFKEIFTVESKLIDNKIDYIIKLNNKDIYITDDAFNSVIKYHPNYKRLSNYAFCLMIRNYYQILGYQETTIYKDKQMIKDIKSSEPVKFVICWTKDGCNSHSTRSILTGGTGQAISIASDNNIPIYNLRRTEDYNLWKSYLNNEILLSDIIT